MKHYAGICLVLVTLAAIAWLMLRSCTSAVDETVDHVRDAFSQVLHLQPQVKLGERVIFSQTAPIAELAVVTKQEAVSIGLDEHYAVMSVTVPLTEKSLSAEAVYQIKAGFDLSQPFTVEVDPKTHAVKASMPHAKILSVETVGEVTYHGDDSLLNRITDDDRSKIVSNLNTAARDAAEKSNLKAEAEAQVKQRLEQLIQHNGQSINIEWTTPAVSVPSQ